MKFNKKMITKYDARQRSYEATRVSAKNRDAYRKPGSRKLKQ